MAALLRHFYASPVASLSVCGEVFRSDDNRAWDQASEKEQFNAPPCLECDREVRDNYRRMRMLPPLTDEEFNQIHGKKIAALLVVNGNRI